MGVWVCAALARCFAPCGTQPRPHHWMGKRSSSGRESPSCIQPFGVLQTGPPTIAPRAQERLASIVLLFFFFPPKPPVTTSRCKKPEFKQPPDDAPSHPQMPASAPGKGVPLAKPWPSPPCTTSLMCRRGGGSAGGTRDPQVGWRVRRQGEGSAGGTGGPQAGWGVHRQDWGSIGSFGFGGGRGGSAEQAALRQALKLLSCTASFRASSFTNTPLALKHGEMGS